MASFLYIMLYKLRTWTLQKTCFLEAFECETPEENCTGKKECVKIDKWHYTLGYMTIQILKKIFKRPYLIK